MSEQNLQAQLDQAVSQGNGLVAQLDAHKQMLSEVIGSGLNLRATLLLVQKNNEELSAKIGELNKTIEGLNQELADAKAKLEPAQS